MAWAELADLEAARRAAHDLRVVTDEDTPTAQEIQRLKPYTDDLEHIGREGPTWDELLWKTQGNPLAILTCGYIADASAFATCFAEWGYLVNFDSGELEVYRGQQEAPHHDGRFAHRARAQEACWPVRLVATFPLDRADYGGLQALSD
ncbi:hypothetical protein SAMN04490356_0876 [Streptomyces melanosporofaciens]|uniref:Uncharacterized protein n=2 Tax=Streptomyces melanosporofaciens TaxID=67327 RepID=A0A1H4KQT4_STRMJ|nr:hypothetical protein SAMN04490356_0876 [Streptomyces melanosporofaciens]